MDLLAAVRSTLVTTVVATGVVAGVVAPPATAATSPSDGHLHSGGTLAPGASLVSADGRYRLLMQTDGNAVLYGPGGTVRFATGTAGHPGASLTQQGDGNLVVYDATGHALWANGFVSAMDVDVTVTDDGAVVADSTNEAWSSNDLLVSAGRTAGYLVIAGAGRVRLVTQGDRNVVEYVDGRAVWSTGTVTTGNTAYPELTVQPDGNVVLYAFTSGNAVVPIWSTGTAGHPGARFAVQADSNLVVYGTDGQVLWTRR